jgi:anti-anti-sigma regulatory factor
VVSIVGDLDGASGEHWYHACTAATGSDVRVDLSATTSIDDDGYSALAAARRAVGARGGTFTLQGTSGTLAQLLRTLRALREEAAGRPAHPDQHCTRAPRRSRGG